MKACTFLVPLSVLILSGCDQQQHPVPTKIEVPTPPTHRFENVSVLGATGVALDTVTGQWCRTWEWQYTGKPDATGLNTLPTCLSLYQQTVGDSVTDLFYDKDSGKLVPRAEWLKTHPNPNH
jgi:hypothetical protein